MHHAIFDGWSIELLKNRLHRAYVGQPLETDNFRTFIQYIKSLDSQSMAEFWRQYMAGAKQTNLPFTIPSGYIPKPTSYQRQSIDLTAAASMGVTPSNLLQVAWAILLARWSEEEEAVFGSTLTGRTVDLPGVEDMAGPTITTLPIRMRLCDYEGQMRSSRRLKDLFADLQQYHLMVIPHQHYGLQNIQGLSEEIRKACNFFSLLVIQPASSADSSGVFTGRFASQGLQGAHTYGLLLSCDLTEFGVSVLASYDPNVVSDHHVRWILQQWRHIVEQMSHGKDMRVDDLYIVSPEDEKNIRQWNSGITEPINNCIHHMIGKHFVNQPDAPAINSWDGSFTYRHLMELSGRLACELIRRGVGPEKIVPLAFEKSAWTIIAMLATLQAGGAFVLLDMALPRERLQLIIRKVDAEIVVASSSTAPKCPFENTIILNETTINQMAFDKVMLESVSVGPDNAAYMMFTSGSTGEPKGCVLQHGSFCTCGWGQGLAFGMSPATRSLQFSSYSFAACIIEIMTTMLHGGCVCVLSEEERMNSIAEAIQARSVNWAFLTPSLLSVLDPDSVPSLKGLSMGGEAIRATQIVEWANRVDLQQGYGNAECCGVVSTGSLNVNSSTKDIGRPYTGRIWLVEPENVDKLSPVGCIGEILIEGGVVGRGYMKEPAKTAAAFISAPAWRLKFGSLPNGTRFYRTGDLGCYSTSDGMLQYIGRKDTQIKYHGQRIELGEIEYHVKRAVPDFADPVVELIIPRHGAKENAVLAAFFSLGERFVGPEDLRALSQEMQELMNKLAQTVTDMMKGTVPEYMIPTVFIPLKHFPMTLSGKTYRKGLREIGGSLSVRELKSIVVLTASATKWLHTKEEAALQQCLEIALGIDKDTVGPDDDFFSLGGDSLSAMRLVSVVRKQGLALSVKDIMGSPKLGEMAKKLKATTLGDLSSLKEFSLLNADVNRVKSDVESKLTDVDIRTVQDIYPALPFQFELVFASSIYPGKYTAQFVLTPLNGDIEKLKLAWEQTLSQTPTLRTRIVHCDDIGTLQVISNTPVAWGAEEYLSIYLEKDISKGMSFGEALCRSAVAKDETTNHRVLVLTIHHALYDGMSLPLIMNRLNQNFWGHEIDHPPGYNEYVGLIQKQDRSAAERFWISYLRGAKMTPFPNVKKGTKICADSLMTYEMPSRSPSMGCVTVASTLRAAWAVLLSHYSGESDVVFGSVQSGRNVELSGVDKVIGPMATVLPMRTVIIADETVKDMLVAFQQQTVEMIPFETMGLSQISRLSDSASAACDCNTLFIVHPAESEHQPTAFTSKEMSTGSDRFYLKPLNVECRLSDKGLIKVDVHFDSNILGRQQVRKMLTRFELIFQHLVDPSDEMRVRDIPSASPEDIMQLVQLNKEYRRFDDEIISNIPHALSSSKHGRLWVTNRWNPRQLVGIGTPGELCVEPIAEEPGLSTSPNPFWETNSPPLQVGKVLRTGVLAVYRDDGSISCVGRLQDSVVEEAAASTSQKSGTTNGVVEKQSREIEASPSMLTGKELVLARLWASALNIELEQIGRDDDFFLIGGDSLNAMRLTATARKSGYSLPVRDIYRNSTLRAMALLATPLSPPTTQAGTQGSPATPKKLGSDALGRIGVKDSDVEEVLPCLSTQGLMLSTSLLNSKGLLYYYCLDIPSSVDVTRLMLACTKLVQRHDILRTVFVKEGANVQQVVLKPYDIKFHIEDVTTNAQEASAKAIALDKSTFQVWDQPIVRFMLLRNQQQQHSRLVMRISHAQFDGSSFHLLLRDLQLAYNNDVLPSTSSFSTFVHAVEGVDKTACRDYWKGVLDGANESRLILHPRPSYSNSMDSIIFRNMPRLQWTRIGFPFPCVLKCAWGIVLGELVNESDVTFGEVIANRRVPMDNACAVLGSCINMVPVRVKMDHGQKPREIMTELKEQSFSRLPYESSPFDVMMEGCTSWSRWPRFSSVVVYQDIPMNDYYLEKTPILLGDDECELTWTEPTWDMADLALIGRPYKDQVRVELGYCSRTIPTNLAVSVLERVVACVTTLYDRLDSPVTTADTGLPSPFPLKAPPPPSGYANLTGMAGPPDPTIANTVRGVWGSVFPSCLKPGMTTDVSMFDLGADIFTVDLLRDLYESQGFKISIEDLMEHSTMDGQIALLCIRN
ncbi:NRPS protein [Monascus purpureus]|nr:NRPS protein [Monascus purpureus]